MKLAFSTLGCPEWTFQKVIDEAHRLGYSGIEVRGFNGVMLAEDIEEFLPENVEKTKRVLKEKGLTFIGFNVSSSLYNPDTFNASIDEAKKAIDVCERMAIPAVRVFGSNIPWDLDLEQSISEAARGVRLLCEYARGKNIKIMLEIKGSFNSIEIVQSVVDKLSDSPEFGIIWDLEHSDRAYGDDWRDFYNAFKSYIGHVHIRDYHRGMLPNGRYKLCMMGDGDIPLVDIINCLKDDGYSGYYSFEWEKKWNSYLEEPEVAFPSYIEYMKQFV